MMLLLADIITVPLRFIAANIADARRHGNHPAKGGMTALMGLVVAGAVACMAITALHGMVATGLVGATSINLRPGLVYGIVGGFAGAHVLLWIKAGELRLNYRAMLWDVQARNKLEAHVGFEVNFDTPPEQLPFGFKSSHFRVWPSYFAYRFPGRKLWMP